MEYLINIWKRSHQNGTACVFRTSDRKRFEKAKLKWIQEIKPFREITRQVIFEKYVIFSYAENADAFSSWVGLGFVKQPLAVRYMKISEVKSHANR